MVFGLQMLLGGSWSREIRKEETKDPFFFLPYLLDSTEPHQLSMFFENKKWLVVAIHEAKLCPVITFNVKNEYHADVFEIFQIPTNISYFSHCIPFSEEDRVLKNTEPQATFNEALSIFTWGCKYLRQFGELFIAFLFTIKDLAKICWKEANKRKIFSHFYLWKMSGAELE